MERVLSKQNYEFMKTALNKKKIWINYFLINILLFLHINSVQSYLYLYWMF
jgi:hypothetical protein